MEQSIEDSPVQLKRCEEVISKASLNFKESLPFALRVIGVYAYVINICNVFISTAVRHL